MIQLQITPIIWTNINLWYKESSVHYSSLNKQNVIKNREPGSVIRMTATSALYVKRCMWAQHFTLQFKILIVLKVRFSHSVTAFSIYVLWSEMTELFIADPIISSKLRKQSHQLWCANLCSGCLLVKFSQKSKFY